VSRINATIQGLDCGTSWGQVVGESRDFWKMSTGRRCWKCNENKKWKFSSGGSAKRTHQQAFAPPTIQPPERAALRGDLQISALAEYVRSNGRSALPTVTNPSERRLHGLKAVVEASGLPQSGTVNGGHGGYRLGNLDTRWARLKEVATALLGRKVAMEYGMHVTLPAAASQYRGRTFRFRVVGVRPKFGYSGGNKYVALLIEMDIPGKGWSDHFHGQQLHMSIGRRR